MLYCMLQGVLLTHRALVAVIAATKAFIDQISPNIANGESIDEHDVILSYLPLVSLYHEQQCLLYSASANIVILVMLCRQHAVAHKEEESLCTRICCRRTSSTVPQRRRCCIGAPGSASGVATSRQGSQLAPGSGAAGQVRDDLETGRMPSQVGCQ